MARVTLKTLSKETGLAASTISEILNGKNNFCSAETRKMVRDTAARVGYVPNLGFKIMTGRNTATTALIFSQRRTYYDDINLRLYMEILERLESSGRSAYTVVMGVSEIENIKRIRELISRGCQEFFFLGSPLGNVVICEFLEAENIPNFWYNGCNVPHNNLMVDFCFPVREFVQHFTERKMNFVCLTSKRYLNNHIRTFFEGHNIDIHKHWLEVPDLGLIQEDCTARATEYAVQAVAGALLKYPEQTGWICQTDHEALGVVSTLIRERKPFINEGGSFVCGFGNSNVGKYSPIPINTVDLRLDFVAGFMLGESRTAQIYQPEIIYRGSTEAQVLQVF